MSLGGKRLGAGRPKGQGKFGEKTKAIRVPVSLVEDVIKYSESKGYKLPLFSSRVIAGFPDFVDDKIEQKLDLNKYLIKHPSATFLLRVAGDSMIDAAIHDGDILIVDRSVNPSSGKIVIAVVNGEMTVKRLKKEKNKIILLAENKKYPPIQIEQEADFSIWGVVTNVIHHL